ncbi:MAG: DUF402 domain-containing protein [Desulfurococcaceae archaeon]
MVNIRVRGIYSTGLSLVLLERGFRVVEASDLVRERLKLSLDTSPCDVTVKEADNLDEILVVGSYEQAEKVYDTLVDILQYVFTWKSRIDLHGVYSGIVVEKQGESCIVDIGVGRGVLYPCKEDINDKVIVGVKNPPIKPGDRLLLTRSFRLVGRYLALIHGDPKVSFSEHIHGQELKARLSTIATKKLMGIRIGVHFRSSSKYATENAIEEEIEELIKEYRNIMSMRECIIAPSMVKHGEFIGIIELTSLAKRVVDRYRSKVTVTIHGHHSFKSLGLSDYVDFIENVVLDLGEQVIEKINTGVLRYMLKKTRELGKIEFIHVKPGGNIVKLGPGKIVEMKTVNDDIMLVAQRVIKTPGLYDGLGVEKKPGDLDYVVVIPDKPFIVHNYYRGSNWIGSYININTPPELVPGIIKYHDLLIDLVIHPNGDIRTIDDEELSIYCNGKYMTNTLCQYTYNAVREISKNISEYLYNPRSNQK